MCLVLDILHKDRHCLNHLNMDQSVLKREEARQVTLAHVLLDEFFEVDRVVVLLSVDKEFCQVANLFDQVVWCVGSEHSDISKMLENIMIFIQ